MNYRKLIIVFLILSLFVTTAFACSANAEAASSYSFPVERKAVAHSIAEQARQLSLPDNDPIILRAKEIWHQADDEENTTATIFAKVLYNESRGINSDTEKACVVWTILNRVDAGYGSIADVVTAQAQFAYSSGTPVWDDLFWLSKDVYSRWQREKLGETNVGRVLPTDYLWYHGDGRHNYFRNIYNSRNYWGYTLPTPYYN